MLVEQEKHAQNEALPLMPTVYYTAHFDPSLDKNSPVKPSSCICELI